MYRESRQISDGLFPREFLPEGESVLFETRPSLWPFLSLSVAAALLGVVIGVFLWILAPTIVMTYIPGMDLGFFQVLILILIGLCVLGVLARLVGWYFTAYGLTNRRVLRKSGFGTRQIVDARFEKIQAITMTDTIGSQIGGYGTVLFSVSTYVPTISAFSGVQAGGILWFAVPDPLRIRALVEEAMESAKVFGK